MPTAYVDDPTIGDDEELWRRIPQYWIDEDPFTGDARIQSPAFDDPRDGTPMSVYLGSVVRAAGLGPESVLMPGFALAAVTTGTARENGLGIHRAPLPDQPAHAEVFGTKTKSVKRRLARAATWLVAPEL